MNLKLNIPDIQPPPSISVEPVPEYFDAAAGENENDDEILGLDTAFASSSTSPNDEDTAQVGEQQQVKLSESESQTLSSNLHNIMLGGDPSPVLPGDEATMNTPSNIISSPLALMSSNSNNGSYSPPVGSLLLASPLIGEEAAVEEEEAEAAEELEGTNDEGDGNEALVSEQFNDATEETVEVLNEELSEGAGEDSNAEKSVDGDASEVEGGEKTGGNDWMNNIPGIAISKPAMEVKGAEDADSEIEKGESVDDLLGLDSVTIPAAESQSAMEAEDVSPVDPAIPIQEQQPPQPLLSSALGASPECDSVKWHLARKIGKCSNSPNIPSGGESQLMFDEVMDCCTKFFGGEEHCTVEDVCAQDYVDANSMSLKDAQLVSEEPIGLGMGLQLESAPEEEKEKIDEDEHCDHAVQWHLAPKLGKCSNSPLDFPHEWMTENGPDGGIQFMYDELVDCCTKFFGGEEHCRMVNVCAQDLESFAKDAALANNEAPIGLGVGLQLGSTVAVELKEEMEEDEEEVEDAETEAEEENESLTLQAEEDVGAEGEEVGEDEEEVEEANENDGEDEDLDEGAEEDGEAGEAVDEDKQEDEEITAAQDEQEETEMQEQVDAELSVKEGEEEEESGQQEGILEALVEEQDQSVKVQENLEDEVDSNMDEDKAEEDEPNTEEGLEDNDNEEQEEGAPEEEEDNLEDGGQDETTTKEDNSALGSESTEGQGAELDIDNSKENWEGFHGDFSDSNEFDIEDEEGLPSNDQSGHDVSELKDVQYEGDGFRFHLLHPKGKGTGGIANSPAFGVGIALLAAFVICFCYCRRRRKANNVLHRGKYAALHGSDDFFNGTFSDDISFRGRDSDDEMSYGDDSDEEGYDDIKLEMGGIHEMDANGGLTMSEVNG